MLSRTLPTGNESIANMTTPRYSSSFTSHVKKKFFRSLRQNIDCFATNRSRSEPRSRDCNRSDDPGKKCKEKKRTVFLKDADKDDVVEGTVGRGRGSHRYFQKNLSLLMSKNSLDSTTMSSLADSRQSDVTATGLTMNSMASAPETSTCGLLVDGTGNEANCSEPVVEIHEKEDRPFTENDHVVKQADNTLYNHKIIEYADFLSGLTPEMPVAISTRSRSKLPAAVIRQADDPVTTSNSTERVAKVTTETRKAKSVGNFRSVKNMAVDRRITNGKESAARHLARKIRKRFSFPSDGRRDHTTEIGSFVDDQGSCRSAAMNDSRCCRGSQSTSAQRILINSTSGRRELDMIMTSHVAWQLARDNRCAADDRVLTNRVKKLLLMLLLLSSSSV